MVGRRAAVPPATGAVREASRPSRIEGDCAPTALETLAVFGVDATSWRIDVGRIPDPAYPARTVTLVPVVDGHALEDFEWDVDVYDDGSVSSIKGLVTTMTPVPVTTKSARTVLRSRVAADDDPFRTQTLTIDVDPGHPAHTAQVHPLRLPGLSARQRRVARCTGTDFFFSAPLSGLPVEGVLANRPPRAYRPLSETVFHVRRFTRTFVVVVRAPDATDAFLVPAYDFAGPSNLHDQTGRPSGFGALELAVRPARVLRSGG